MDKNTKWPDIILLNGSSSAGKSTLAKGLQRHFFHPYLHFGFDDLVFMMPGRYWESSATPEQTVKDFIAEGVEMREIQKPGESKQTIAIFGPVFRNMINAMPAIVESIVNNGTSVIFDHIFHDQKMYDDCQRYFAAFDVLTVGVLCSLEVLEKREQERGDRVQGRARGLVDIVHSFCEYDVEVDTSKMNTTESIAIIEKHILG